MTPKELHYVMLCADRIESGGYVEITARAVTICVKETYRDQALSASYAMPRNRLRDGNISPRAAFDYEMAHMDRAFERARKDIDAKLDAGPRPAKGSRWRLTDEGVMDRAFGWVGSGECTFIVDYYHSETRTLRGAIEGATPLAVFQCPIDKWGRFFRLAEDPKK